MDAYSAVLREFFRLVGELWLAKIEARLQKFADALDEWLRELFARPMPDWRERLAQFLAVQEAEGYLVAPESREDLVAFLEGWEKTVDWRPRKAEPADVEPTSEDKALAVSDVRIKRSLERRRKDAERRRTGRGKKSQEQLTAEAFFDGKLAQAQKHLNEIGEMLEALAAKLDAARLREAVTIEADADAIEKLICGYNKAIGSARTAWLRGELSGVMYERLARLQTPSDLHVPAFTDRRQAHVAKQQEEQIGQRLGRRTQALERILAAIKMLEAPAPGVLLPIGGGVVATGVQTTGPWSVVMYVPSLKGFPYAEAVNTRGADTLSGLALASTIITWWLGIGRSRPVAPKPARLSDESRAPAPKAKARRSPRPSSREPGPRGALASRGDDGGATSIRYNEGREGEVAVGGRPGKRRGTVAGLFSGLSNFAGLFGARGIDYVSLVLLFDYIFTRFPGAPAWIATGINATTLTPLVRSDPLVRAKIDGWLHRELATALTEPPGVYPFEHHGRVTFRTVAAGAILNESRLSVKGWSEVALTRKGKKSVRVTGLVTFSDMVDANLFLELRDKGYFSGSWWLFLAGYIEGVADLILEKGSRSEGVDVKFLWSESRTKFP